MTARELALHVLLDTRHFAWERLDVALGRTPLSAADRRLATELVYGSLRRRGSLDLLIGSHTDRPTHRIHPAVWELLRLGAYQLVYLSHIPPHAAVSETVELAKTVGHGTATGFVNGVLRGLGRSLTGDTVTAPAADALPLANGTYRRLTRPILPDPATQPAEYLAAGFSLSRWLADRWLARFGSDEAARLGFWFAEPAPLWVRVNPLRTTRDALRAAFVAASYESEPGPHPQSLRLAGHAPIRSLPGYSEGWFTVQDLSAMAAATALAPQPGMTVLDLCAAPGGKTTHLAELMHNAGHIVAGDIDEGRLRTVSELAARLGIGIIETRLLDTAGKGSLPEGPFDAVLLDVPCSNTGVLGRRPEVRWRLRPEELPHLVRLQHRLLHQACERVRPGGVIVYSTCSIEPEEDGLLIRALLKEVSGLVLEAEEERTPGRPADGGYWARLRMQ
jgi:16S rRNA (cytosine967-C5)-methyltransferase